MENFSQVQACFLEKEPFYGVLAFGQEQKWLLLFYERSFLRSLLALKTKDFIGGDSLGEKISLAGVRICAGDPPLEVECVDISVALKAIPNAVNESVRVANP